jgi:hypothetical protein
MLAIAPNDVDRSILSHVETVETMADLLDAGDGPRSTASVLALRAMHIVRDNNGQELSKHWSLVSGKVERLVARKIEPAAIVRAYSLFVGNTSR